MIFLKDSLELHSLKAGNLEVLPYFCCVQKIRKDFVSFYLHGGLIRVYKTGCSYKRVLSTAETWSEVASLNVAVGNLSVVKRQHYIPEMSQNYLCFKQLHC
jgi:hypothetical protein